MFKRKPAKLTEFSQVYQGPDAKTLVHITSPIAPDHQHPHDNRVVNDLISFFHAKGWTVVK